MFFSSAVFASLLSASSRLTLYRLVFSPLILKPMSTWSSLWAGVYSLTILAVGSLKSTCQQGPAPSKSSGRNLSCASLLAPGDDQ